MPDSLNTVTFFEADGKHIPEICQMMKTFYAESQYPYNELINISNLEHFLIKPEYGKIWLLSMLCEIHGYLIVSYWFCFERGGRNAFIDEFYLSPLARGMGCGTALLEYVSKQLVKEGIVGLQLEVEHYNLPAQKFYKKMGFKKVPRIFMNKDLLKKNKAQAF